MLDDHARTYRIISMLVDDDDTACAAVATVGVGKERLGGAHYYTCDVIRIDLLIVQVAVERVDVESVAYILDHTASLLRGVAYGVLSLGVERLTSVKPADHRLYVLRILGHIVNAHDHISSADIDIVF